jgi:hypothetical protein
MQGEVILIMMIYASKNSGKFCEIQKIMRANISIKPHHYVKGQVDHQQRPSDLKGKNINITNSPDIKGKNTNTSNGLSASSADLQSFHTISVVPPSLPSSLTHSPSRTKC